MSDRTFERLVRAHADAVHAYARALTNDPWLAEEAVQMTFVRAWKYQDSFRGEGSYEGWLLRICRNLVVDLAAKRRHDQSIDDLVEGPAHHDDATTVTELGEALSRLPAAQREVLTLCGLLGYDYAAAAELLDVPIGTVRSRLHRGRATLDSLLSTSSGDDSSPDDPSPDKLSTGAPPTDPTIRSDEAA